MALDELAFIAAFISRRVHWFSLRFVILNAQCFLFVCFWLRCFVLSLFFRNPLFALCSLLAMVGCVEPWLGVWMFGFLLVLSLCSRFAFCAQLWMAPLILLALCEIGDKYTLHAAKGSTTE
eukprot:Opistho-2@11148